MIQGHGVDIVEIDRIREMITKYGDHFLRKVFTESEIAYCGKKAHPATHFAGRWASKEAYYKALPGGCQRISRWKSVEIIPDENGRRPTLYVLDEQLAAALLDHGISKCLVSISHEKRYCIASVLLQ